MGARGLHLNQSARHRQSFAVCEAANRGDLRAIRAAAHTQDTDRSLDLALLLGALCEVDC